MQMTSIVLDLGTTFMLDQISNDTIWFHKTCIYKVFKGKNGQVNTHSDIKMIFLWKLIYILNYHGDKSFLTRLSLPIFEVKIMLCYRVTTIGTDMVNFNSFGGVLMPNYQEQNSHWFCTNSYTPYIIEINNKINYIHDWW